MSASLVGSEMCIRDSPGTTKYRREGGLLTALKESLINDILDQLNMKGAVSYTHLTLPTICSV
eukprot:6861965-Alexandrium_andersonii.AAC.1